MDGSFVYFAMDYYPAGDLTSYLSEFCKMGIAEIQFFGAQLAMAIQFLHSVGVVHRDIKLENIFIDGDGYIKLGDFGMAKNIGADGRTFSVCGSFNYMAPEMLKIIEDKKKIRQNQPVSKSKVSNSINFPKITIPLTNYILNIFRATECQQIGGLTESSCSSLP